MDQSLKQRLVGVVIITALAAIFVPMLFDDPVDESDQMISELGIPPSPVLSYEQGIQPAETSVEEVLELPEPDYVMAESDLEEMDVQPEVVPEKAVVETEHKPQQPVQPKLRRWVIQVGSFGAKSNAENLKNKLIKQGFTAFVDSYQTKQKQTLFRVRVGPELDRKRAEQMQAKLEKLNNIKSILKSE